MKKFASIALVVLIVGCASTQTTEYKTIAAAETGVNTAYNGYLDLVEQGKIVTNAVPQISKAYNDFQSAATIAILTHGLSVTNPVPPNLALLATSVLTLL